MAADKHSRTEKATGRKLQEARKKGQVARSRDLGQAGGLAAAVLVFGWAGTVMVETLGEAMTAALSGVGDVGRAALDADQLLTSAIGGLRTLTITVAPVAMAAAIAAVGTHTMQSGWVVATEALKFDWSRLSPVQGFKRLGFKEGGINVIKMIASVAVVTWIGYDVVLAFLDDVLRMGRLDYLQSVSVGWGSAERLLRRSAVALVLIALIDYGVQRWKFTESMRMTKHEVKEDSKQTDGNPEIKSRVRRVQREIQRRRMIADVERATVVITNPTEYAVAILYDRAVMTAPRVLAKGRGVIAARIKAVARDHGVPIVENVPLAQALYRGADVNDSIPADLFEAVAGVLAYLIRLKQLVL